MADMAAGSLSHLSREEPRGNGPLKSDDATSLLCLLNVFMTGLKSIDPPKNIILNQTSVIFVTCCAVL